MLFLLWLGLYACLVLGFLSQFLSPIHVATLLCCPPRISHILKWDDSSECMHPLIYRLIIINWFSKFWCIFVKHQPNAHQVGSIVIASSNHANRVAYNPCRSFLYKLSIPLLLRLISASWCGGLSKFKCAYRVVIQFAMQTFQNRLPY